MCNSKIKLPRFRTEPAMKGTFYDVCRRRADKGENIIISMGNNKNRVRGNFHRRYVSSDDIKKEIKI